MDAVTFLKEYNRLCTGRRCSDCPLESAACRPPQGMNIEKTVSIVEKWSKEHPRRTNADVFREVFDSNALSVFSMDSARFIAWTNNEYIDKEKS